MSHERTAFGYYLMRNNISHGWFATKAEAERYAAASNMRGGALTQVVADTGAQA